MIRKIICIGTFSVLALGLTGCETMTDVKNRIAAIDFPSLAADEGIKATDGGLVMAATEGCPQVAVVEDLKHLSQFETPAQPSPETNISRISMTGMKSSCRMTEKTVAVDIGLRFDAELGPKTNHWKAESRSFAYPYFVAVTTPAGEIISKEVFAATIRYDANETALTQEESMRQIIPLREDMDVSGYEILIGFQLTDDELNYNRTTAAQSLLLPATDESPTPEPLMASGATPDDNDDTHVSKVEPAAADHSTAPMTAAAAEPPADATVNPAPVTAPVAATPVIAGPQQQVIRIKADGSVETQAN